MKELELLALLEKNAKQDPKDLAIILETDESWILDKMSELEKEKVICGYHTIINWDKTNKEHVTSIIYVDATPERDTGYDNIARKIYKHPEVESMYLMSGKSDFLITIQARTMKEVADFVATKLACIHGVTATSTLFVLQTYKTNGLVTYEEEKAPERLIVTP